jgi:hypothetical protein
MFQVGSFVFGVITVMAAAPDVFNPKTLHIMKNKDTSSHAKGTVTISNGSTPIEISYQEHEQRNGRLLAQLEQHQLDPDQLLELSEQLMLEQDKLAKGRARYAGMASMDDIMLEAFGHLLNKDEEN